jgi:uncharacterized phiE125 gp8 family phage protein
MTLSRITAPATGLITLAEAQAHLRVDDATEDSYITALVNAASAYLDARDGVLGEALVTQTWRYSLPMAPLDDIALPLGPVVSVTVVKYIDAAGVEQTYSSANYRLADGVVELVDGASWPSAAERRVAFWVDFVAGYGAAADVPETIRQLCRLLVGDMFESRAAATAESFETTPAASMLLQAARSHRGLF